MDHEHQSGIFAKSILMAIRSFIDGSDRSLSDFPRWVQSANIRIGELNGSSIIHFERRFNEDDEIVEYRSVGSDVEFVFPQRTAECCGGAFDISVSDQEPPGLLPVTNLDIGISDQKQCFANVGNADQHRCLGLFNLNLTYEPHGQIEALRYVPCMVYVCQYYLGNFKEFWNECGGSLLFPLTDEFVSQKVDTYSEPMSEKPVMSCVDDTVIVLGNYEDPYIDELREVRDRIMDFGYDVFLIEELPSRPQMSLEESVRLWTTSSRFCVMVDREASGHIKEYEMVKNQRKPLVFLQPNDGGSTYMIGDDGRVDVNHIRKFEFTDTPLSRVEDGVRWAEEILTERGDTYPNFYPWMKTDS